MSVLAKYAALLALAGLAACAPGRSGADGQPAGYGASVTSEGDVLTREQIDRIGASRTVELFEGRFAGVQVRTLSGRPALVIRGYTNPLIVIDGVRQSDEYSLWALRPDEIEEIRILRDAGTASYGTRGARGVVEVTTRER